MSPSLLILGCGYLGEALGQAFASRGWTVAAWVRTTERAASLSRRAWTVVVADLTDANAWASVPRVWNAAVYCAAGSGGSEAGYRAIYCDGVRHACEALDAATPLLFTSSTSVFEHSDGSWVDEATPLDPQGFAAAALLEGERLCLERNGCVARLAALYGPGRCEFLKRRLPCDMAGSDAARWMNFTHRDDAVRGIACLFTQRCSGIYHVVDDAPVPRAAVARWVNQHAPERTPEHPASGRAGSARRWTNKRVSNARMRGLGWRPRYPSFREGLLGCSLP